MASVLTWSGGIQERRDFATEYPNTVVRGGSGNQFGEGNERLQWFRRHCRKREDPKENLINTAATLPLPQWVCFSSSLLRLARVLGTTAIARTCRVRFRLSLKWKTNQRQLFFFFLFSILMLLYIFFLSQRTLGVIVCPSSSHGLLLSALPKFKISLYCPFSLSTPPSFPQIARRTLIQHLLLWKRVDRCQRRKEVPSHSIKEEKRVFLSV